MHVEQLHHGSIVVADLSRAVAFYRDVLGLEQIPIPDTFVAAELTVAWFKLGPQQLHLLQSDEANPPTSNHLALQISDSAEARTELRAKGLDIEETITIPGADRFFIRDLDGNLLELIEWGKD